MAAYAEGLNILHHADAGMRSRDADAETTPLRNPEYYQYELDLPEIAELWRRGSVIGSWLLDLTARALLDDPGLEDYAGRVSDSGEGRWTLAAADRRRRAGARDQRGALLALRIARRGRLCRPAPLRHAKAVRRARREEVACESA